MSLTEASSHMRRVKFLYKTILRLHRGLPPELCELGSAYMRDEFKRHKQCSTSEANIFMSEWTHYALTLAEQLGLKGPNTGSLIGLAIEENRLEDFREDQIAQLYQLLLAAAPTDSESKGDPISSHDTKT